MVELFTEKIDFLLVNGVLFFLSITVFVILRYWKSIPPRIKPFRYFILWNFIIEVLAWAFYANEINNLPLLHLYTLGEFIFLSLFFEKLLNLFHIPQKNKLFFVALVCILILLNSIFLQSIYVYNSNAKSLIQLLLIVYSLLFFFQSSTKFEQASRELQSIKLINSAILVYYSGSLFVFMFSEYFQRLGDGIPQGFWIFNALLNLIFQVLILIAIWQVTSRAKKAV